MSAPPHTVSRLARRDTSELSLSRRAVDARRRNARRQLEVEGRNSRAASPGLEARSCGLRRAQAGLAGREDGAQRWASGSSTSFSVGEPISRNS